MLIVKVCGGVFRNDEKILDADIEFEYFICCTC